MFDVIILAGGKGTRMGKDVSKPLVLARNREIIAWQLDNLYTNYSDLIGNVIVAVSFKADEVQDYLARQYAGKNFKISFEEHPLGTGGAIKQAVTLAETAKVIVLNVDDIVDINLQLLTAFKENMICVAHPILPFGLIKEYNGSAEFIEKPRLENFWVSCGWYLLDKAEIISKFPDLGSVEYDVFQKNLVRLKPFYHTGFWRPLNSKKELEHFSTGILPKKLRF
jgi:D-glycero-alpha-D-manno-heptose 1-phosphate guanylyltransferase